MRNQGSFTEKGAFEMSLEVRLGPPLAQTGQERYFRKGEG